MNRTFCPSCGHKNTYVFTAPDNCEDCKKSLKASSPAPKKTVHSRAETEDTESEYDEDYEEYLKFKRSKKKEKSYARREPEEEDEDLELPELDKIDFKIKPSRPQVIKIEQVYGSSPGEVVLPERGGQVKTDGKKFLIEFEERSNRRNINYKEPSE